MTPSHIVDSSKCCGVDVCCEKIFIEPKRNVTTPIKTPPISRYLFSMFLRICFEMNKPHISIC